MLARISSAVLTHRDGSLKRAIVRGCEAREEMPWV
jgi:hypothetical protein